MQSIAQYLEANTAISLGDINAKSRTASLFGGDGKPIRVVLAQETTLWTPWQVSAFDASSDRCSMDLVITSDNHLGQFADAVDTAVFDFVKGSKERYIKGQADLAATFRPCRRKASKEGYNDTLRCKMTRSATKCSAKAWDGNKVPVSPAELKELDWTACKMAVAVAVSGVYFQAGTWGPILNVHMLQVAPQDRSCPFGAAEDPMEF